jgi:anti-sigma regulatory factor (Ser/Thr protein kinase)
MQYGGGEASDPQRGFVHQALIYDSDQAFIDVSLSFVREGIEAGEPTLVAVQRRNVDNLREALGGADGVTLLSVEQWYETSARSRDKFARWASAHLTNGGHKHRRRINRVRLIGEPPWAVGNDAQVRDWARHESVINVALDGLPVTFICPYDARELPDGIIEHARATHPEIVDQSGTVSSAAYEDPREFCRRLDSEVRAPYGTTVTELTFALGDLAAVRRVVESAVVGAGLPAARVGEMVLAVNEIATNAVIHGRPPAMLRVWKPEGELVFEVSDAGEGIRDVLAGQLGPAARGLSGRGLWLTRLLSDAVEVRNGDGCAVSIHATAPRLSPV